jgi:hypothetical protein
MRSVAQHLHRSGGLRDTNPGTHMRQSVVRQQLSALAVQVLLDQDSCTRLLQPHSMPQ